MIIPKNPFENLSKKGKAIFLVGLTITHLLVWVLLIFILPIFYTQLSFLFFLFFIICLSFISWQLMGKKALVFMVLSLVAFSWGTFAWGEENYCLTQGERAEKDIRKPICMSVAENEKKYYLGATCVYPGFKAHMDCHRTFKKSDLIVDPSWILPNSNYNPTF